MKHLILQNPAYRRLIQGYGAWLELLNFEPGTVSYSPVQLREFLHWLESEQISDIGAVTRKTVTAYFDYLRTRKNRRKGGTLSRNYLLVHLQTLRKAARYLRETGQESFEAALRLEGTGGGTAAVLSGEEIRALYGATGEDLWGMRDRAMLGVYYGCGLRRSEGAALETGDVLLEKELLYVRKGKNYRERYVPMSGKVREHLREYLTIARPALLQGPCPALFIGRMGKRLSAEGLAARFKKLLTKAEIEKQAGLHTLRHSIATHLLASGMALEQIRLLLGHRSLESTQIYTHLLHEQESTL